MAAPQPQCCILTFSTRYGRVVQVVGFWCGSKWMPAAPVLHTPARRGHSQGRSVCMPATGSKRRVFEKTLSSHGAGAVAVCDGGCPAVCMGISASRVHKWLLAYGFVML